MTNTSSDSNSTNPYATPSAQLRTADTSDEFLLASRWKRLLAIILDSIILVIVFYIFSAIIIVLALTVFRVEAESLFERVLNYAFGPMEALVWTNLLNSIAYLQVAVPLLIYFLINGYLLATKGQSIGKLLLRIAIVDKDTHEVPPLSRIFLRRYMIIDAMFIINFVLSMIIELVDVLSIFRRDRRMIHDMLANTIVIEVRRT